MKVLKLGWESAARISRESGRAFYRLSRAVTHLNAELLFLLPTAMGHGEGVGHVLWASVRLARVEPSQRERRSTGNSFRAVTLWLFSPYSPPHLTSQMPAQSTYGGTIVLFRSSADKLSEEIMNQGLS
jgi:hypothetical protein